MNEHKCPVCGSADLVELKHTQEFALSFGDTVSIDLIDYKCNSCGIPTTNPDNDKLIVAKLEEKQREQNTRLIEELGKIYSLAGIERALGLPQRTLTKWKNEKNSQPTAAGYSLIKMIYALPWLVNVADDKYDKDAAIDYAMKFITNEFQKHNKVITFNCFTKENINHVEFSYTKHQQPVAIISNNGLKTEWKVMGIGL